MSIRRKPRRQQFTTLDNALVNDPSLNFAALGALVYLLSKPDDWVVRMDDMQKRGSCGRMAVRAIMDKLRDAGYAELIPMRTETGVAGTTWEVSEEPTGEILRGRKPDGQETRRSGNLTVRKPAPLTTTESLQKTETAPKTETPPTPASHGTTRTKTIAAVKPPSIRAQRPLFDAFMAAFPGAAASLAGKFDNACVKAGFTVDDWHAFMATPDARQDYPRFLTKGNALDRFTGWASTAVKRTAPGQDSESAHIQQMGAPTNWRDIVYAPGGVKRAPFLALPRMGLEPYAAPATWPAWYREVEGVSA